MAGKLKVYQTSLGFFDLAIAAPSMKAALEAWGAESNLFHQGAAKESDDPQVIAATMSKPGVILKRPVGSNGPFGEHAELPYLSGDELDDGPGKPGRKQRKQPARKIDDGAARRAASEFEKSQKQLESERRRQEAARIKERERREKAVAKAQAVLEKARREHDARANAIEGERAALEKRAQAEEVRWQEQKERLEAALHRAQH